MKRINNTEPRIRQIILQRGNIFVLISPSASTITEGKKGMQKNVEMVRVVRETVGDDVDIMLECYMGFNFAYSKQLLKELEPYTFQDHP